MGWLVDWLIGLLHRQQEIEEPDFDAQVEEEMLDEEEDDEDDAEDEFV